MIKLFSHQQEALYATKDLNRVAYYLDMGLGKTFVGSEKMKDLGAKVNLVICQKSKIGDWYDHFMSNYRADYIGEFDKYMIYDLSKPKALDLFMSNCKHVIGDLPGQIGIINYELAFRRPELLKLEDFTLMLDESSMVQNETAKRSKFILKMKPKNVILLSGTPTAGKYEKLWSQCKLLGWPISKTLYWKQYIDTETLMNEGYPITVVRGYKNVDRLKQKLRDHGAVFMKSEEVFDLPEQIAQTIKVDTTKVYRNFRKNCIVTFPSGDTEVELVGDTTLTKMLYERMLCGQFNSNKLDAFRSLLESTEDRIIVFYNFTEEWHAMAAICESLNRPHGIVNGQQRNLEPYENESDSITFIQYQAGAMGLNLQKANKIIYYTPPLSSELFEQSKKRIHRIGQKKSCFYYYLVCRNSIENKIYDTLAMRRDYTNALFEQEV